MEAREGEDSACRKDCRPRGVGGTTSEILLENDLSNAGVRMVRFAGRRLPLLLFWGIWRGEGGAKRWCLEDVSTTEAVAIGGRDCDGGGIRKDRFFRLRSRRPGETGRSLLGADNSLELSIGIMARGGISMGRVGGMNLG